MKGYPNTYALSKLFAEDLVQSYRDKFPSVITRPSVVTPAWQEPYPGYVESKRNGLPGWLLTRGRGALRTLYGDPENTMEIMPVDIANNAILALACKRFHMEGNEVLYCNLTNSKLQDWTMKKYFDYEMEMVKQYPLDLQLWWPYCPLTKYRLYYDYRRLFYHYFPALVGDLACRIKGEKPVYA